MLALLDGTSSHWRELVCNLCEPVAVNALGLSLLAEKPRRVHISAANRDELLNRLRPCSPPQLSSRLNAARMFLCEALALTDQEDILLAILCENLAPRLSCAVARGELSHVFFSFGLPGRR